ncbi:MAG: PAS domain-containing protein [Alphaproteobacteria bacterium]|nr:PAS domain-containing protein [Alphaproteobacteria bacterium]
MQQRTRNNDVSLSLLLKAVVFISAVPMVVLAAFVAMDVLSLSHCVYAYITLLMTSGIIIRPYLADIAALTRYVNELARDSKIDAPELSRLGAMEELSTAVRKLHYSWGSKKQQMESMISEREVLVDTIPDILLMIDENGIIVRANAAARQRFGQHLSRKKLEEVAGNELLLRAVQEVKQSFKGQEVEFYLAHPTQSYYHACIERFPVHSPGGIALIVTLQDITELKRTEQMRADFVANASHEIRTPLASLIGFIETLQGPAKDDPAARAKFLGIMADQAGRMSRLVNDLLSLSKLEMNANTVPVGAVNVATLIHKVKDGAGFLTEEKNVTIKLDIEPDLPPARGEESEIHQVIENLVGNAIKYGRADSIVTIRAWLEKKPPRDKHFKDAFSAVAISVRDQGTGIAKEHLSRLTERFYRVNRAESRKVGGTGLGLAIVKHILNRHRGAITIESTVGVGSTFTIYFHVKK